MLKQLQTLWIVDALFVLDRLWANTAPTLIQLSHLQMFMQNGEYTDFWYLQLRCNFNLRSTKTSYWIFLVFSGSTAKFWRPERSASRVCTAAFKVSISPLNRCFRRSRVRITLIKPLLCLNSIFPHQKECFINTQNSNFSIALKICHSNFT